MSKNTLIKRIDESLFVSIEKEIRYIMNTGNDKPTPNTRYNAIIGKLSPKRSLYENISKKIAPPVILVSQTKKGYFLLMLSAFI